MNSTTNQQFEILAKVRRMENLHIVFWLFKDMSWCLNFQPLAIIMIFPTLIIAVRICIKNKNNQSELFHNLAVVFWIMANSCWMLFEFSGYDETEIIYGIEGRYMSLIFFFIGILILAVYYIFLRPRLKAKGGEISF
jgi:hypothetical protein